MPRPKLPAPSTERADLHHENIAADLAAMDADSLRRREINERFGDGAPYDRARVVDRVGFYSRRTTEDMLELGKAFVFMKENEEHGEFLQLITELGYAPRTVQNLMRAAVKFLAPSRDNPKLLAMQPTKLIELAVLDDDEIKALAKGETVAGLALDEIDTLSVSELRERVREVRKQLEAKDKVIADKIKTIERLAGSQHQLANLLHRERSKIDEAFNDLAAKCGNATSLVDRILRIEFPAGTEEADAIKALALLVAHAEGRYQFFIEEYAATLRLALLTAIGDGSLLSAVPRGDPKEIRAQLDELAGARYEELTPVFGEEDSSGVKRRRKGAKK
ncbi:MAG: hypothetical protein K8F93_14635 [Burkholderiales bacterium]|nr:hypothetical protein [Burkholderiales bacterium]